MDFLNQAIAQVRELLLSMSPAARITATLLLGVIVVSLGYLVQTQGTGADEYLFNGDFLDSGEANRIDAALAKSGKGGYVREGNRFKVTRGMRSELLAAVANDGALPANLDTLLQDSMETNPLLSDATRKQQWKAARERQLSMIVKMMDGVEDAKVLYDIRPARGFEKEQITATVSIVPSGSTSFGGRQMGMIRKAVAGAIAGLKAEQVTVLDLSNGAQSFGGEGGGEYDNFDDPYYRTRIAYEERLRNSVQSLLSAIPGLRVQVTAELDDALTTRTRDITSGEGVAIRQITNEQSAKNTRVEDRGPVGPRANGPGRTGTDESVAKNENETTTNQNEAENFIPTTEKHMEQAGLTPKHVRVAVAIPTDYCVAVWRERNKDKPADKPPLNEELDPIKGEIEDTVRGVVAPMLPKELAKNPFSDVSVEFFQSLASAAIEPPSTATTALFWAGNNANTLLMTGLALVSLVMLRSMVKSIPNSEPVTAFSAPAILADSNRVATPSAGRTASAAREEADAADRPKLKLKKGPSLKDDLLEVVRDDPDAAAAILRSWIGNAG